jgi:hypothetical protein
VNKTPVENREQPPETPDFEPVISLLEDEDCEVTEDLGGRRG